MFGPDDEEVTRKRFVEYVEVQLAGDEFLKDTLIQHFDAIDKDGDGKVNEKDLISALAGMFQHSKSSSEGGSVLIPSESVVQRNQRNEKALDRIIDHLNELTDANAGDLMVELKATVQALDDDSDFNNPTALANGPDVCTLLLKIIQLTEKVFQQNEQLEEDKKQLMKYKAAWKKQKNKAKNDE